MAWTRVQHTSSGSGHTTAARTLAYPSSVTSGDLLIVAVSTFLAAGTPNQVSISDTVGSVWHQAGVYGVSGLNAVSLWYASAGGTGANTVTAKPAGTADQYMGIALAEYGGDGAGATLNATASGGGNVGTAVNIGTIAVNNTGELVLLAAGQGSGTDSGTAGAGFTLIENQSNGSTFEAIYLEDDSPTSAGVTGAMSIANNPTWAAVGASFKPGGGVVQVWPYLDTGLCGGFADMGMGGV